jgi:serine protease inhibitor
METPFTMIDLLLNKMKKGSLSIFVLISISSFNEIDVPLTDSINSLGLNTLKSLHQERNLENILISPTSIFSVNMTLFYGLSRDAKEKFKKNLRISVGDSELIDEHSSLQLALEVSDKETQNITAHSMWFQNGLEITDAYISNLQKIKCEIDSLDFINQFECEKRINDWVRSKTKNRIPQFLKNDLPISTQVVLANTNFFSANWSNGFDVSKTVKRDFFGPNVFQIDYMKNEGPFPHYANNYFEAISIPYSSNQFTFIIYLPGYNSNLNELLEVVTNQLLLEPVKNSTVKHFSNVELPKFSIDFNSELNDALQKQGLWQIYGGEGALSGITKSGDLMLDKVIHSTSFKVDETGTEAASTSGAILRKSMESFKANRPFLFAVVNTRLGIIQYLGTFENP